MLAAKGLETVSDLLYYAPFRYEDRRNVKAIRELAPGEKAAVLARVGSARLSTFRHRSVGLFEASLQDGSGANLTARWFHGERFADSLTPGTRVAVFGKVELERSSRNDRLMVQPELEILSEEDEEEGTLHSGRIVAVYEAAGKISTRVFRSLFHRILKEIDLPEDALPRSVRERLRLPDLQQALRDIHCPAADADVNLLNAFRTPAQTRLIFEEFFWLECGLTLKKTKARAATGISFALTEKVREQIKTMLPFKPTAAQKRVMQEIANDMKQPHPMNRLLQGDVGSGKTIVAAQAAIVAMENGYQAVVLAPTGTLAAQHHAYFTRLLSKLNYPIALLTGSLSGREKQQIKKLVEQGFVKLVVGTHALLESDVVFSKLGLVVIDEQHRFGVRQRLALMEKGVQPDVLVMTATPIPRTLALTLYGDLDVSVIDELPPGRRPIITKHAPETQVDGVYSFLAQQIAAGRQAYVVYPLVEESENAATIKAAENMFQHLSESVFPGTPIGLLHGRMPAADKEAAMQTFKAGQTKILVSTTVIEVGVDVPNASVIVIEQAERFGLAQIHQLRGRVGRGPHQSYCVLVTSKLNDVARERIRTVVDSSDGFYIAEMDMKLRGPGEFYGTKQSGIPGLRLADLLRDGDILELARKQAHSVVSEQPDKDELRAVVRYIQENWQRRYSLAQVG